MTTIFLGQNEIPAIVKPFIERLNRNELFTAICSGMASIAGSMMIGYAGMGVPIDYLLAASLMAIPGDPVCAYTQSGYGSVKRHF